MSDTDSATQALQQFDAVVAATPGMRARSGQRRMAEEVARTFARAQLARDGAPADGDEPRRAIAVIEALSWITPVSLLTCCTATNPGKAALPGSTRPV